MRALWNTLYGWSPLLCRVCFSVLVLAALFDVWRLLEWVSR